MAVTPVVSPSTVTPGLYLTVNLISGAASPGTGSRRICVLATKSASGDLTDNTEVRTITGVDAAATAFGPGTLGHLACKIIFAKWPQAIVDGISPIAGATAATLSITAAGAPTAASVADLDFCGRTGEVVWEVGESPTEFAAKITTWVNGLDDDLPASAAAGGAGISVVTAKVTGNIGNDILVKAKLRSQTGTETLTGATTWTPLAGGTTDPDFTLALTALVGRTYRYFLPCISNTDATNVATSNNIDKVRTHINAYNTGLGARLQQQVVGCTSTVALSIASVVHTNSGGNDGTGEMILCLSGRSLPAEVGARELIGRAYRTSLDPAANRINEVFDLVHGSGNLLADTPTPAEAELAVGTGVSILSYTAQEELFLVRAVTMHCQTATGGTDRRLLDTQNVDATYDIAEDLQTALPEEFRECKLAPDNDAPSTPLPPNTIQPKDVKAFIINDRMRYWERRGVIDGVKLQAAIDNDEFVVEINASDASQLDIVVPESILPPLAKMGVEVNRIPA